MFNEFSVKVSDYQEFMTSLSVGTVDLILTDPPYCISKKTGFSEVGNGVQRFAVSNGLRPLGPR